MVHQSTIPQCVVHPPLVLYQLLALVCESVNMWGYWMHPLGTINMVDTRHC